MAMGPGAHRGRFDASTTMAACSDLIAAGVLAARADCQPRTTRAHFVNVSESFPSRADPGSVMGISSRSALESTPGISDGAGTSSTDLRCWGNGSIGEAIEAAKGSFCGFVRAGSATDSAARALVAPVARASLIGMSGITLSHRGQRPREPVLPSGTLRDASQWGHRTFMLPCHRNSPEVEHPRLSQISDPPRTACPWPVPTFPAPDTG